MVILKSQANYSIADPQRKVKEGSYSIRIRIRGSKPKNNASVPLLFGPDADQV